MPKQQTNYILFPRQIKIYFLMCVCVLAMEHVSWRLWSWPWSPNSSSSSSGSGVREDVVLELADDVAGRVVLEHQLCESKGPEKSA